MIVRMLDNSMSPIINKGDAIFIDPNAPFEDGKVAVANIDGAIICGKAYKTADGYELKNEVGDTFYTSSICGIATWRRISLKGGEEE